MGVVTGPRAGSAEADLGIDLAEAELAEAVVASLVTTADGRLREVLESLVRHLHGFARETRLTLPEWERAVEFLTDTGQTCSSTRQEFILLSDVLGLSMLVETIADDESVGTTDATVLGPFHMVASPRRALGETIDLVGTGQPCVVVGTVRDTAGTPVPGATVDVWQADDKGFYDVQQPGVQPAGNGRGLFEVDAMGAFWFRTVTPRYYPIPTDGPVGRLLAATGRHPYRPAHIHFIVQAPGHRSVTTHIFVAGSEYLDSDAVFAVRSSLVRRFDEVDDPDLATRHGVTSPFRLASIDLVVSPLEGHPEGDTP